MKYALDACLREWSFRRITRVIGILLFIAACSAASIAPQPLVSWSILEAVSSTSIVRVMAVRR